MEPKHNAFSTVLRFLHSTSDRECCPELHLTSVFRLPFHLPSHIEQSTKVKYPLLDLSPHNILPTSSLPMCIPNPLYPHPTPTTFDPRLPNLDNESLLNPPPPNYATSSPKSLPPYFHLHKTRLGIPALSAHSRSRHDKSAIVSIRPCQKRNETSRSGAGLNRLFSSSSSGVRFTFLLVPAAFLGWFDSRL